MWPFKKRKISGGPSDPEQASADAEYDGLPLDQLQARLEVVEGKLNAYDTESTQLFKAKMAGNLHDGDYNIKTSAIDQDKKRLEAAKQELLRAIGKKMSGIARIALAQDNPHPNESESQ